MSKLEILFHLLVQRVGLAFLAKLFQFQFFLDFFLVPGCVMIDTLANITSQLY